MRSWLRVMAETLAASAAHCTFGHVPRVPAFRSARGVPQPPTAPRMQSRVSCLAARGPSLLDIVPPQAPPAIFSVSRRYQALQ